MRESKRLGFWLIAPVLLAFLFAKIWLTTTGSGETWAYFSGFEDQLINISTGLWASPTPPAGTSLEAEKTAAGFWEQRDEGDHIGVRGEVCVANDGDLPTENLAILDVVQIKVGSGEFVDYVSAPVDVSVSPLLMPGESRCYSYEIEFSPVERAKYRNLARVTITNHSGWLPGAAHCPGPEPCPYGPQPKAGFRLPGKPKGRSGSLPISPEQTATPTPAPGDESGDRDEAGRKPRDTSPPSPTPWTATPTPTADLSPTLPPTPTLAPTQDPPSACTHSVEYWKNHPGKWPLDAIILGGRSYSHQEALFWLATPAEGDVSISLVQQLIAVRLNLASGADPAPIENQLVMAVEWLAVNPPGSAPKGSASRLGRSIAEKIEVYNLGRVGPGACEEDLPTAAPTMPSAETPTWTPTLPFMESPTPEAILSPSPPETPTPEATATPEGIDAQPSPTPPLPSPTLAPPHP